MVHARFEPLLGQTTASFTTGVAATEDGSPVVTVTVADGERTIMIGDEVYDGIIPSTLTGVSLDITDQDVRMVFRSGLQVNVRRWFTFPDFTYIGGVYVYAPVGMETVGGGVEWKAPVKACALRPMGPVGGRPASIFCSGV